MTVNDSASQAEPFRPKILVFSTKGISDIGIDLAGSLHMHYPPSAIALPLPCSSAIKPQWILHALTHGFDGVFIAADGTDCPFLQDCTDRTARINDAAQILLRENQIEPEVRARTGIQGLPERGLGLVPNFRGFAPGARPRNDS